MSDYELAASVRSRHCEVGGDTTAYLLAVGAQRLLADEVLTDAQRDQLARVAGLVHQRHAEPGGDPDAVLLAEVTARMLDTGAVFRRR